ncbi:MAG: leucyl aminopeptidase [Candidatus Nitrosocosmicus sp.]
MVDMVNISIKDYSQIELNNSLLVVGLYEDYKDYSYLKIMPATQSLSIKIDDILNNVSDTIKKFGKNLLFLFQDEHQNYLKILFVGLGKNSGLDHNKIRQIGGLIALKAKELGNEHIIIPDFFKLSLNNIQPIVEGLSLSLYEFNKYKGNSESSTNFFNSCTVDILSNTDNKSDIDKEIKKTLIIAESVCFARDLANSPPNFLNPSQLANYALSLESSNKIKVKILDRYQMENLGLNGIISVGKGSENPPKLIIMEYNQGNSTDKPILLVGKAVTFDTGGISIKPSEKMDEMKFDKSGGCNILGIFKALSALNLPINVVGIVPSVENMPSSSSYRPGDIIKMHNGKTVEVLNTDAEGRLILADALSYGIERYAPKYIIDFATLTGACIIALGSNVAGLVGNNQDLIQKILRSSDQTGEKIWQLPLFDEYFDLIKSNAANIKNIGGRTGGAITAAAFLAHFVNDVPWAHIDIAGTAWTQDGTIEKSYNPKGSTGFGVRTIIKLLEKNIKTNPK